MKSYALTDVGLIRSENQDCYYISEVPVGHLPNLYIVADGMGGYKGGKYASHKALDTVLEVIKDSEMSNPKELLKASILAANDAVLKEAEIQGLKGMGTTFVAATIVDDELLVANVGDSRLYVVDSQEIRQITEDHSLVQEMVRCGEIAEEDARDHEKKNVITRAIGAAFDLEIDFFRVGLKEGDKILMCSDGLTNMVEDESIRDIIYSEDDVMNEATRLVEVAKDNGGKDNITVVLINL